MKVEFRNVSKRYNTSWIFRDFSFRMDSNNIHGISGPNGSGKSTLLQMIAGYLSPTEGIILYGLKNQSIERELVYEHLTYAAPYVELIEELSLLEFFEFSVDFKPFWKDTDLESELQNAGLWKHRHKFLKQYSSGMKQKVRLLSAILAESQMLLLDEPTSFLDDDAKRWCYQMIKENKRERLVIIASNEQQDLALCDEVLQVSPHS